MQMNWWHNLVSLQQQINHIQHNILPSQVIIPLNKSDGRHNIFKNHIYAKNNFFFLVVIADFKVIVIKPNDPQIFSTTKQVKQHN